MFVDISRVHPRIEGHTCNVIIALGVFEAQIKLVGGHQWSGTCMIMFTWIFPYSIFFTTIPSPKTSTGIYFFNS